jgi:hypothetical protein
MIGTELKGPIMKSLRHLINHGWIPLRSMSCLLGYSHPTGIYSRQKSGNAISTVQIGGRYRVCRDVVLHTLKNAPVQDQAACNEILSVYYSILKQEHKHNPEEHDDV